MTEHDQNPIAPPPAPTGGPVARPEPGWYANPDGGEDLRWWDGTGWTQSTTSKSLASEAASGPGKAKSSRRPADWQTPGEWLSQAVRLSWSRAGDYLAMVVLTVMPATMAQGVLIYYAYRDSLVLLPAEDQVPGIQVVNAPEWLQIAAWVSVLVTAIMWVVLGSAAMHHTQAELDEAPQPWLRSLGRGFASFPRTVLVAMVILVALFVMTLALSALVGGLAVMLLPFFLPILMFFVGRLSPVAAAAAIGERGTGWVSRSWRLGSGATSSIAVRLFVMLLVAVGFFFAGVVLAQPIESMVGSRPTPLEADQTEVAVSQLLGNNPASIAIGQLFSSLGASASIVVWAAGVVLIFKDLGGVARTAGKQDADEPASGTSGSPSPAGP